MRGIESIILAAILGLLTACGPQPKADIASGNTVYFDLKKYLESEITRLDKTQPTVLKTVSVNGKEEQQTLKQLDYRSELTPLLEADINRPAWEGKYRVDSTHIAPGEWTLTYTATDEKPPVRTMSVRFQKHVVESILIERAGQTLMAGSSQKLSYRPAAGFEVETLQKVVFMSERNIRMAVAF